MKNKKEWNGMAGLREKRKNKIKVFAFAILAIVLCVSVSSFTGIDHVNKFETAGMGLAALPIGLAMLQRSPEGSEGNGTPEQKELLNTIKGMITEANKNGASKTELDAIKLQLTNFETSLKEAKPANYDTLIKEHSDLMAEVKALKETGGNTDKKLSLKDALKEHAAMIKKIAQKVSSDEVVVKTLLQRSAINGNQNAFDIPEIGTLATRRLSLYDLFPKLNIGKGNHNGTIRYYDWDEDTIVRAAAAVAEGAAFPESVAAFKKYAITIQKIGDTLPVTEEFFEDEALFAAELEMFLQVNVQLEVDRQLYEGDGTGNTITGLLESIDSYTLPVTGSIVAPNIYDLAVKVSEQITVAGGSKFSPDVIIANMATINRMRLAKDANDNYILPPFVGRDGQLVANMVVVESNIVADNVMVVGDRRFARIYEVDGITMSKGTVNAQFTEDEMTLKVRKRLAFLIRNCDKGGFRKVLNIDAALTALTIV